MPRCSRVGQAPGSGRDHSPFQGLNPVLLILHLQGTHPLLKQVPGQQLPWDASEEVLEEEGRAQFGLSVSYGVLASLPQLGSLSGILCPSCHGPCRLLPAFDSLWGSLSLSLFFSLIVSQQLPSNRHSKVTIQRATRLRDVHLATGQPECLSHQNCGDTECLAFCWNLGPQKHRCLYKQRRGLTIKVKLRDQFTLICREKAHFPYPES